MNPSATVPSVLILRSTCAPLDDDAESTTERGRAPNSIESDGAKINKNDGTRHHHGKMNDRKHLQRSLQLSCDITVLPEIPVEEGRKAAAREANAAKPKEEHPQYIRITQQVLNPCGMENVLLLPDLPPSARGYLLSLTSCNVALSDSVLDGYRARTNSADVLETVSLQVRPIPSTFSFKFDEKRTELRHDEASQEHMVMVGSQGASATLDVAFDFTEAMSHFSKIWNQSTEGSASHDEAAEGAVNDLDLSQATSSNETETQDLLHLQMPIVTNGTASPPSNHDHMFHLLQTVIEKQESDFHMLTNSLGFFGVFIFCTYVWTAIHLIRGSHSSQKQLRRRQDDQVIQAVLQSSMKNRILKWLASVWPLARKERAADPNARSGESGTKGRRPPLDSVTVNRRAPVSGPHGGSPVPPSREFTSSSSHSSEPSSLSTESVQATVVNDETQAISSHPKNREPSDHSICLDDSKNDEDSSVDMNLTLSNQNGRKLSPCSKLARNWMQSKSLRRSARKQGDYSGKKTILCPSSIPVPKVPCNSPVLEKQLHASPDLAGLFPPTLCPNDVLPMSYNAEEDDSVTTLKLNHEQLLTTPRLESECRSPTVGLGDTFIQDYWGM